VTDAERIAELLAENAALREELTRLRKEIEEWRRGHRERKKRRSSRQEGKRAQKKKRPGRKKGHAAASRPVPKDVDRTVEHGCISQFAARRGRKNKAISIT